MTESLKVEPVAGFRDEANLFTPAFGGAVFRQQRIEYRITGTAHRQIDTLVVEPRDARFIKIVRASKFAATANRPIHRRRVEGEHVRDLIEQFDRFTRLAVELVDERHDRNVAQAADLEQLARAAFDALRRVDDHDGTVDGGQRSIGLVGEILVARRIEQIKDRVPILERHHRRDDRDAARPLDGHPVGAGVLLVFFRLYLAGELNGTSEKQKLFRERRLAGVRVRDDREGPPAADFALEHGLGSTAARYRWRRRNGQIVVHAWFVGHVPPRLRDYRRNPGDTALTREGGRCGPAAPGPYTCFAMRGHLTLQRH